MKNSPHGHNCHGVAVDVFMTMATRHRWEEVSDVWPDDDDKLYINIIGTDYTWVGRRTFSTMTHDERHDYERQFYNYRNRKFRSVEERRRSVTRRRIMTARSDNFDCPY